jgi:cystine transport system ATP-binding protein
VIELTGIVKSFGGPRVLDGVDLTFAEGSVTALIGPSGGGKSTLLRCINLLEIPTSGRVRIGEEAIDFAPGIKVGWRAIQRIRRQTGMVFQNFQLFPHRTAIDNVAEGLITVLGWPRPRALERARALLDKVGLALKADAWPATLSGGQQQRVAIARALAPSPRVLLCDEPTSALDPELSAEVVDVLAQLAREGTTMVIATHDLRLAASIAQQAVFLEAGKVVEEGLADRLFSAPRHERTRRFIATLTDSAARPGPRRGGEEAAPEA